MSRLHPFTLLAIAAGLPILAWILPAPRGGLVTAGIALGLVVASETHGSRRGLGRGLIPVLAAAAPFWLFLFLLHDWATTVAIALRLTTMIASFLWLAAILEPPRLVEAMVDQGWSVVAAYLFAAALSAVPTLKARAQRILDAQRCRGLRTRGGPAARFRALRAVALPLVLSALHDVDERALALETRGLVAGARRTPLAPPADSGAERAGRWGLMVVCAGALAWRLAWRG